MRRGGDGREVCRICQNARQIPRGSAGYERGGTDVAALRGAGYACDMQRMYYVLKDDENDAPEDLKKAFGVVKKAIELACGKLRPGVSGMEVDAAVRDFIIKSGFDDFDHALGHSVGRLAHDGGPLLAPARQRYKNNKFIKTEISENMIFALEPSLNTRAGHLGLEDEVVVKKEGAEFLIQPQEELYIVGGTLNV